MHLELIFGGEFKCTRRNYRHRESQHPQEDSSPEDQKADLTVTINNNSWSPSAQ